MSGSLHDHPNCLDRSKLLSLAKSVGFRVGENASVDDVDGGFPFSGIADLAASGLLLAPFSTELGGSSLGSPPADPMDLFKVLTAIGRGSLPLGRLYEGHVNAVKLVARYGDRAQLDHLLYEATHGRPTGVWMAETEDPLVLEASDEGGWVLRGRKILASGAGHFRRPLVAAKRSDESVMIIPYIDDHRRVDASAWTVHGMRATATGTVDFTGITIDGTEIVGGPGDYMRSPLFRGGAWRVLAVQLGGIEAIMNLYGAQLAGSRNPDDPLQLERWGDALIAAETARLWVERACRAAEDVDGDPATIDATVDLARNAFERAALIVIASAQKAVGLRAFTRPNPLERIIRDLSTYLRQPALDASLLSAATFHLRNGGSI